MIQLIYIFGWSSLQSAPYFIRGIVILSISVAKHQTKFILSARLLHNVLQILLDH